MSAPRAGSVHHRRSTGVRRPRTREWAPRAAVGESTTGRTGRRRVRGVEHTSARPHRARPRPGGVSYRPACRTRQKGPGPRRNPRLPGTCRFRPRGPPRRSVSRQDRKAPAFRLRTKRLQTVRRAPNRSGVPAADYRCGSAGSPPRTARAAVRNTDRTCRPAETVRRPPVLRPRVVCVSPRGLPHAGTPARARNPDSTTASVVPKILCPACSGMVGSRS